MHSRAKEKCLLDYPEFRPFLHSSTPTREDLEQVSRSEMGRGKPGRVAWSEALADRKFQVMG